MFSVAELPSTPQEASRFSRVCPGSALDHEDCPATGRFESTASRARAFDKSFPDCPALLFSLPAPRTSPPGDKPLPCRSREEFAALSASRSTSRAVPRWRTLSRLLPQRPIAARHAAALQLSWIPPGIACNRLAQSKSPPNNCAAKENPVPWFQSVSTA